MKNLRSWNLPPAQLRTLPLAADARISRTSYTDDQVWDILVGQGDEPAIALHTRYGSRAGLVSLVPMWTHEGRVFYQAQTYITPPHITHFCPDTAIIQAELLPGVQLEMLLRAMESQAFGGIVTLHNTTAQTVKLRLDWFAHVGIGGKEQKTHVVELSTGGLALALGAIGNLQPLVMVEQGSPQNEAVSARIGAPLILKPHSKATLRWLQVGLTTLERSATLAQRWFKLDWQPFLAASDYMAAALPKIESSDEAWDAVIALSYNRLVQAFLRPSGHFPQGTLVATRTPDEGFSKRGDGSDYQRSWGGQDPHLAYLVLPIMSTIAPQFAQGVILNYLAVQNKQTGAIDFRPGAGGQRLEFAAPPLLATLTWRIYEQTHDDKFLKDAFSGLFKFFTYWQSLDADSDGYPEWQDERQLGYVAFPTFAPAQSWGQGLDVRRLESPDLGAYLLVEAQALSAMAEKLGHKSELAKVKQFIKEFMPKLNALWAGDHFAYRDRDTHTTAPSTILLHEVAGDEEHYPSAALPQPSRLIVRVIGGVSHVPRMTLKIEGVDEQGIAETEVIESKEFLWHHRWGVVTTQRVFAQVDRIVCEGLSRVYRLTVQTPNFTALDINALLPLAWAELPTAQRKALVKLATDPAHFWRTSGISMVSAQAENFDASNANGGGGVWLYWATRIGEGLLAAGEDKKAAELLRNILTTLTEVYQRDQHFYQFYHADAAQGSGETDHLSGIVPLYLFQRALGVLIVSPTVVWIGGEFAWHKAVTLEQHGVIVKRSSRKIAIKFPSGHKVEFDGATPWQRVVDPIVVKTTPFTPPALPDSPNEKIEPAPESPKRIIIKVEREN